MLEPLAPAGAVGAVGVLDYPSSGADGSYFPYGGHIRTVPGLYVDRGTAWRSSSRPRRRTTARLSLPAKIKQVKSRNLIGFIPGRSRELITLHCHTDGSNAIEDNGPGTIVAIAQYLARLPRQALPRTVLILLTTGHFHGGNGARAFCRRHADDLVPRTKAALTIEHSDCASGTRSRQCKWGRPAGTSPARSSSPGRRGSSTRHSRPCERAQASARGRAQAAQSDCERRPERCGVAGGGSVPVRRRRDARRELHHRADLSPQLGDQDRGQGRSRRLRAEAIAFTEMILQLGRTPADQLGRTLRRGNRDGKRERDHVPRGRLRSAGHPRPCRSAAGRARARASQGWGTSRRRSRGRRRRACRVPRLPEPGPCRCAPRGSRATRRW